MGTAQLEHAIPEGRHAQQGEAGLEDFTYRVYTLRLRFADASFAGWNISNYIRGAFGNHLLRLCCACPRDEAGRPAHMERCIYARIFETPLPTEAEMMRKYPHVPHPFVIFVSKVDARGAFAVELVLIGRGNDLLPYYIMTFLRMGRAGIGAGRVRFIVESITSGGRCVYDPRTETMHAQAGLETFRFSGRRSRVLALQLLSPCAIARDGKPLRRFDFRTFCASLLRRINNLAYFHVGVAMRIDFRMLLALAENHVRVIADDTHVFRRSRYSSRQKRSMDIGGLIGQVRVAGELARLLPYLELGTIIHNGKKTSFGNGRYSMRVV